jgi:LEA14-like dessication related protein
MKPAAIVILVIIILGAGGLYTYFSYSSLEIELEKVELKSVGITSSTLVLFFQVSNPSLIPVTISSGDYEVFLNDQNIGTGSLEKNTISGNSEKTLESNFEVSHAELGTGLLITLTQGGIAEALVKGKMVTIFGSIPFRIVVTTKF